MQNARRMILACGLALAVAGCSSDPDSDWSLLFSVAKGYWSSGNDVSLEQAAAVPYASVGVRLGDSQQIMAVLATNFGPEQLWIASGTVAIRTRNGRIVQTSGLPFNLTGFVQGSSAGPETWSKPRSVHWQADFDELNRYSVGIDCADVPSGPEQITILEKQISALRVDESCHSDNSQLDWTFSNVFWVDPSSGTVWRSIQHVNPQLDPIELTILRPVG